MEAGRILDAAEEGGLLVRLTGGVAIALLCPSAREAPLRRPYHDLDFVVRRDQAGSVEELLGGIGYVANSDFNALHGAARLIFGSPAGGEVDVFVDRIEMCHRIEVRERLANLSRTLTPADLLLTKLQVVETTSKDLLDIVALCADIELTPGSDEGIDSDYLAAACAGDWGLWRTATMVAGRARDAAQTLGEPGGRAEARLRRLLEAVEAAPKSRRWKLRARVGDRVRWYELPEEAVAEESGPADVSQLNHQVTLPEGTEAPRAT